MQIECTEEKKAEAATTFALLSTTLQVEQFISLLFEYQMQTLQEAHDLLFGACVPTTVKRQILEFLKVLSTSQKVNCDAKEQARKSLDKWDIPKF